jgi:hypothetical protein
MSLAITAASVENEYNDSNNYNNVSETPVNRKRNALQNNKNNQNSHNKTQKRVLSDFNPEKVNSVLESIYSTMDVTGELADYNPRDISNTLQKVLPINPLNPPESAKSGFKDMGNKDKNREGMSNINNSSESSNNNSSVPQPLHNDSMDLQELNQAFLNDAQVRDYYRKLSPTYNPHKPLTNTGSTTGSTKGDIKISDYSNNGNNDVLLNKLNYMINLLENQQDERTNNVTEEVVLYSFLGVFIIFVVDSFARVGKYVR